MKKILQYIVAVALMLTTTACEWGGGDYKAERTLGLRLWQIASHDLERVNEIFDFVAQYNHMLNIEDETQRENYRDTYFSNALITEYGNIHSLTYVTSYNTKYCVDVEMYNDRWHITRSGGKGYDLTVTPLASGRYMARFDKIYNSESMGEGEFIVEATTTTMSDTPIISYTGTLTMVDPEENPRKPLTITTKITEEITYSSPEIFTSGMLTITAYDAVYDSTDVAKVTILKNNSNRVVIECFDDVYGYDL